jgi:hypothetical protein
MQDKEDYTNEKYNIKRNMNHVENIVKKDRILELMPNAAIVIGTMKVYLEP